MGKQVNFYLLGADEQDFIHFVLGDSRVLFLGTPSFADSPRILNDLPSEYLPELDYDVYLWRQGDPLFLRHTIMTGGPLTGREVYFVDSDSSVIEFSRSRLFAEERFITRGRIWADMQRLENGVFVYKGEEFEKWYDGLAAWIRKHYRKIGTRPYTYIGPEAFTLYEQGFRLQGL